MASKQAKAKEFSPKIREVIKRRDGGCIFCRMNYQMDKISWFDSQLMSIMHYIPRSKGGLGIEQNGALGCQYHHSMLDNGHQGRRVEMLEMFKGYLQSHYDNWNEEELYYRKWR